MFTICLSLIFGSLLVLNEPNKPKDLLVLYDSDSLPSTHSGIINLLKDYSQNGYDLMSLGSKSVPLVEFDELKYKNLVLISNSKQKWSYSAAQILDFADKGGNLFIMDGPGSGKEISTIVTEIGFGDSAASLLIDHPNTFVSTQKDTENVNVVVVDTPKQSCESKAIFPDAINSVLYRGRGFVLDKSNPTTFPIIAGSNTSYLFKEGEPLPRSPLAVGTDIVIVGGVEMRNLARIVLVGSTDLFSDSRISEFVPPGMVSTRDGKFLKSGNLRLFISLCDWVFQRRGILRIVNPSHHLVSTGETLDQYVVEKILGYNITVEEQQLDGTWKPFVVKDMQLELIRLTIFTRVTYSSNDKGLYTAEFHIPDYIGTYGLRTYYRKLGYTTLDHEVKIVVRPRRHNDYDRFIFGAYPYYITAFSMMIMTYILVFGLLNQKPPKEKTT